jgi:hypothetical protein
LLKEEVGDMEAIACPVAAVMVVTGATVPMEGVAMVVMEVTANTVPVETAEMVAMVQEEEGKEAVVAMGLKEMDQMAIMEILNSQD